MIPTPQQLKAEIEGGVLAPALAPHWGNVFPAEVEPPVEDTQAHARWVRISPRFGLLTGDGIDGLLATLNDPGLGRTRPEYLIPRGKFAGLLAGIAVGLANKPEAVQNKWRTVLSLTPAGNELVDVRTVAGILDAAVGDGLLTPELAADIKDGSPVACSRLAELGWTGVTADLLNTARGL